jgi:hypothetical protein
MNLNEFLYKDLTFGKERVLLFVIYKNVHRRDYITGRMVAQ